MPASDSNLQLDQCACSDLQRASRVVSNFYNDRLRAWDITAAQFSLLRGIERLQPVGMGRLAEAMVMDRTSVTRVVEPLVQRGLVSASVGDDRRVRNLELTAQGLALAKRAKKGWEEAQQQLLAAIGEEQWLTLRKALRTTVRSLRQAEPTA